ncbi:hypothetical protein ACLMJK_004747 [Lecanora helva]
MDFSCFSNIINGKPCGAKSTCHGINPATEEALWEVPCASEDDLKYAVDAAERAFSAWSETSYEKRCELVVQYAEKFLNEEKGLIELLMKETGKPVGWVNKYHSIRLANLGPHWQRDVADREIHSSYEGMLETSKDLVYLTWGPSLSNISARLSLKVEKIEDEKKTATMRYVPLGNLPSIVSRPLGAMPYTPYTTLKAIEVGHALFPPGVLQVLGGDDQLGPWMTAHARIQKISFTGSILTGKKIMEACAKTLKRVTLELGGNDAAIVCPDVDIEKTAPQVVMSALKNSGQICVATKRLYIHHTIYTPFLTAMTRYISTLKTGDPLSSQSIDLGPLQNAMQYQKVLDLLADCKTNGYTFATPAPSRGESLETRPGYFIAPTIIDNPPSHARVMREEQFGPLIPAKPYTSTAEVVDAVNDTNTGLGATIWTQDIEAAEGIAQRLEVGSVYINSALRPDWRVWFGGWKESGIGGERGQKGLEEYCRVRAVHVYK